MANKQKKNSIFSGLFWTFGERISAQFVSTFVTIVLARLLDPEHYGVIAMVTVFISVCNVFVTSGFGSSLVQKKDADDLDFDSALILSIVFSLIIYVALFLLAPSIADLYNMDELSLVVKVMGIRLPIAAVNCIQQAYIRRKMEFRRFFIATLFGTVVSGFVGIVMAYMNFGVWALVAQYLTNTTVDTIVLSFVSGWKPRFRFSYERAKHIFGFGWKVLATDLVFTLETDIRSLIIGKFFGAADLAYYDQGKKYPSLLVTNIDTSINKVMLPAYSENQDDLVALKNLLRKAINVSIFILGPVLLGFAAISNDFVKIILSSKWMGCAPIIQIMCISMLTRPLQTSSQQAILAIGKSEIVLYIMIIINIVSFLTLLISTFIFHSVVLMAFGLLLSDIVGLFCFMITSYKLLNYSPKDQCKDIFPTLTMGILMTLFIMPLGKLNIPAGLILICKVICGSIIYITLSWIFKLNAFIYIKDLLISKLKKQ